MAKQIPDDFMKKLRSIPIEEVAGLYFDLQPMGNIYQTTCIHKGDNSPSLTFFKQTNTFFCFGCGAGKKPKTEGSDVISFVMWIDNCSFVEAVAKIASFKGLEVPKTGLSPEDKKKQELLARVMTYNRLYWDYLQSHQPALTYLNERGIDAEDIAKWRIGFISEKETSHTHKGKLVFGIMNDWGQTVGFSHRDMTQEFTGQPRTGPKYVNSPKSPIFDKGSILYGLHFVRRLIREKGYVVVGEGFGDAILGQKAGLPFVSTMGTSLTDQHIETLKQYTDTVVLWMDGDQAGISASLRHAKVLQKAGMLVKVINYPGEDPDDVLLRLLSDKEEASPELADTLVDEQAMLSSHYEAQHILALYESRVAEIKLQALSRIIPVLQEIPGTSEQTFLKSMVATRLGVNPGELKW